MSIKDIKPLTGVFMNKIHVLPETVSSKIAAGEVIDRPASAVRELIDNSADAGSTSITVRIEDAGIKSIVISDNGAGIDGDDFPLVFTKHATSKISDIDDLANLFTMGFRGEALHSIQTVSKITVTSNTDPAGKKAGLKMTNSGDDKFKIVPTASKKGTKVEVDDIFYNMPARRKFLKSKITELNAVKKTVSDKALAFTGIAFDFFNDGKRIFSTKGDDDFKNAFFSINRNEDPFDIHEHAETSDGHLKIRIFHSSSDVFFQNRKHQSLFVNRRPVSVNFFYPAIDAGYRNFISPGRYPLCYVFIDIDPALIDVNIHPAKKEIKFVDQNRIFNAIQTAVSNSFSGIFRREITGSPDFSFGMNNGNNGADGFDFSGSRTDFGEVNSYLAYETKAPDIPPQENGRDYRILGVVFDTYIITEKGDRVFMIDQHAAAEAIIYRKKKERHATKNVEKLLIPAVIEIDKWNANTEKKIALLNDNGFSIEMNEGCAVTVREIPEVLLLKKDYTIACDIITEFLENSDDLKTGIIDHILIESSCKEAIKKGDKITLLEMAEIVDEYFKYDITNCPHGRPSHFELTKDGLEKIFQRKK
jgi:DNA mismatch repair protein MutL